MMAPEEQAPSKGMRYKQVGYQGPSISSTRALRVSSQTLDEADMFGSAARQ